MEPPKQSKDILRTINDCTKCGKPTAFDRKICYQCELAETGRTAIPLIELLSFFFKSEK